MTNEEIIEGNKLIAEFIEWDFEAAYTGANNSRYDKWLVPSECKWMNVSWMKFHTSWDWLMPVVEKIEEKGFYTDSEGWNNCQYFNITKNDTVLKSSVSEFTTVANGTSSKKIGATWLAVVGFINWYNNQNK